MLNKILVSILSVATLLVSNHAVASSQCTTKINSIYADPSSGNVAIYSDRAPETFLYASNTGFKAIYAAAVTALGSDRPVIIRYAADGIPCTSSGSRNDINGFYLQSQ